MAKAALVVMAAGIGSRFGGGIKQLAPIGPNGELLIDYSVYDAMQAGFDKVVFVIRKDLEEDFKSMIGERIEKQVEVVYAYQEIEEVPMRYQEKAKLRKKPWGTGQAILCCKNDIHEPFLVINADDYYGKEAYQKAYQELTTVGEEAEALRISMIGFVLGKTLSDNGTVTRGVCSVDEHKMLKAIEEIYDIEKQGEKAVGQNQNQEEVILPLDSVVSMNMWGLYPSFFQVLEKRFQDFLEQWSEDAEINEYLLPILIGDLLEEKAVAVHVRNSSEQWFGVTYMADKELVVQSIQAMIGQGKYPENLYEK
jgi:dTDP-glucose pyrophosphorylase